MFLISPSIKQNLKITNSNYVTQVKQCQNKFINFSTIDTLINFIFLNNSFLISLYSYFFMLLLYKCYPSYNNKVISIMTSILLLKSSHFFCSNIQSKQSYHQLISFQNKKLDYKRTKIAYLT